MYCEGISVRIKTDFSLSESGLRKPISLSTRLHGSDLEMEALGEKKKEEMPLFSG